MARKPRISFPGALHHIILRGNHKEEIFLCDRDRRKFIELLNEYYERYLFRCYAYSLMPNHIHLLIEEDNTPLPRIMQGINQSYTQYFNARYEKVGHLFQGRYKAILVDKDRYLLILVRYIHLNPVRALLVKRPEDYPWSSYSDYICEEEKSFVESKFVLSLFSKRKKQAIEKYKRFIEEGLEDEIESNFENGPFIGDEEFTEKFLSKLSYKNMKNQSRPSLNHIETLVAHHFKISEQLLHIKSRERRLFKIRGLIGYLASKYANINQKEIAKYFNRSASTTCHAIRRISEKLNEDSEFRDLVEQLVEKLLTE